ncbi:VHS2 [[Candida] subhashii]|uniref:VHS2 n=1 Tax=[Candida] subhashii TaxID=561895 RepID=A0A8J5QCJ1_9ASCO|nr:VHS2 [[Candida] subhashii]KAG7663749.1 VHS2 [[Candida] subhashii]
MSATKTITTEEETIPSPSTNNNNTTKEQLSLFTFGSSTTTTTNEHPSPIRPPPIPFNNTSPKHSISSIISDDQPQRNSTATEDDYCIFERSVQDACVFDPALRSGSIVSLASINNNHKPSISTRPRSATTAGTHNSSISLTTGQYLKNEDYIPPALDATASLLCDRNCNLDDVELVYSPRRNSSLIALNMALGRSSVSRKNSTFSLSTNGYTHSHHGMEGTGILPMSPSSTTSSSPPPLAPGVLPTSKSQLNFYSYAEMINDDSGNSMRRRPSFKHAYSQGFINPPRQRTPSAISPFTTATKPKHPKKSVSAGSTNKQKFLISPESSDSEVEIDAKVIKPIRSRTSVIAGPLSPNSDNESLVSSSIGECIRQTTNEINGH